MNDASEDVRDALASITTNYEVEGELHAVPPHAVYEVRVDGRQAICKVARGPEADPATEARVVQYVGRETSVPVPHVLTVGDDWFVAEWRDDLPEDPVLDAERARVMGAGLATLHDETAGAFEKTGFPRVEDGTLAVDTRDVWNETVRDLLADRRDYLVAFGYDEVAEAARSFLAGHPEVWDGAGEPVLVHGNYLPDHVGVADGGVTCVVDWEHALVAPAEYDYWRTAMPLFGGPNGADEAIHEAFREGYESVRPLPDGFDRRATAFQLVNMVSYLKALHLQRQRTRQGMARFAVGGQAFIYDRIEELRERMA